MLNKKDKTNIKKMISNSYSPLNEIRQPLKILRWTLGFPLQALDATFSRFRFVPWMEFFRFSTLILISLVEYLFWAILFLIDDGNINNLIDFYADGYNKVSASKIEQSSFVILRISTIIFAFVYIFHFKWNANTISDLCKEVNRLKENLSKMLIEKHEERKHRCYHIKFEYSTKTILYGQILNVLSSLLYGVWILIFLQNNENEAWFPHRKTFVQIVYPIVATIAMMCINLGPMTCSAELVVGQIVDSITQLYCQWEEALKYDFKNPN